VLVRRLVQVVTALAVAATPVLLAGAPAEARPSYRVEVRGSFSPDGDGVQDTLRVRYTVPKPTKVRLEVSRAGRSKGRVVRSVELGWKARGTYTWTWDGRNDRGNRVGEGLYLVALRLPSGTGVASDRTKADTSFTAELTSPVYGVRGARARVFPRSTEVEDAVPLMAYSSEKRIDELRLVIRNATGKVVRDADVDDVLLTTTGYRYGYGGTVSWAAQRGGKPLPKGSYTAVVTGRDKAGNTGSSKPLTIWVSGDELVWKEVTTTVTPTDSRFSTCTWSTANGCGDYPDCGSVTPNAAAPGALSYRSKPCADPSSVLSRARGMHLLEVPEATGVRGLSAVRVSFTGAPTTAGEADTGSLEVWSDDPAADTLVRGTSGQSAWVDRPTWGEGLVAQYPLPARAPAAAWTYTTTGDDAVDITGFTVSVRYLVVAD
jgi:hypothetical protein